MFLVTCLLILETRFSRREEMLLWKEVVKPGVYFAQGRWVRVRDRDIQDWVDNFQKMRETGLQIPVPYEHPPEASFGSEPLTGSQKEQAYQRQASLARNNAGWLADLEVRGKSLFAKMNLRDEDAKKLQEAGGYVSPHFRGFWTDGNGRTWKNSILHMAITLHPVNVGQSSEFNARNLNPASPQKTASFSAVLFSGESKNQFCNFSLCDLLDSESSDMPKASLAPKGLGKKSGKNSGVSMGTFPPKKGKKKDGDGDGKADCDNDGEDDDSADSDESGSSSSSPDGLGDSGDDSSDDQMADSSDATADSASAARIGKLVAEMATLGVIVPKDIDLQGDIDVLLTAIQTHKATKDVGKSEADASKSDANAQPGDPSAGERQVQPVSMSALAAMSIDEIASQNPAVKNLLANEAESQKSKMLGRVDNLLKTGRATIPQATKIRDLIGKHSFSAAATGKPGRADSELEIRIATLEENPENASLNQGGSQDASFSAGGEGGENQVQQDGFFTATGAAAQPLPAAEVQSVVKDLLGIK